MRLTVIGCSGSLPGPESAASCYLLEAPDAGAPGGVFRLLLDLGSGALGTLQSFVDLASVGAVAFSHLHADHCLDLCGFYVVRRHHPRGPWGQIPVWGPTGLARRFAAAYDIDPEPGMSAEFAFHEYDGTAVTVGPFTLLATRVDHPVEAYALRVSAGAATLAYTGDSGPCEGLLTAAEGADLLLSEASFHAAEDNPEHLHLTGPEAAELARAAGVDRLVLTHVPPWYDPEEIREQAAAGFGGSVQLARPGLVVDI